MIHAEIPRVHADLEKDMVMVKKTGEKMSCEELSEAMEKLKEKRANENEKLKPAKANDRQVGGAHYKDRSVQPWDVVDAGPHSHAIGYYRWSALAYIMRAGDKGPAREDYEKALHYIEKLLEIL
jgi:hypothetical protein